MPTCVECGSPVTNLYTQYSKDNIRLTHCDHCRKFADKYVEHDFVIIFMDMLLHKPQVYRHLLFNRLEYRDAGIDPSVMKLGILLVLFDVYIKWFHIEKTAQPFLEQPLAIQYVYILALCILEFLVFHLGVRLAVSMYLGRRYVIVKYNYISMALIIASFGKMLLILMVIWDYKELQYGWLISIIVLTSNVEALKVFLNVDYFPTLILVLFGMGLRLLTQWLFLRLTIGPQMISLWSV